MYVAGLWRYPVKSLAGEALSSAQMTCDGISGDRLVHVAGPHSPLTGRTRHSLLTLPAATGPDGVPWVAGHRWDSPQAVRLVRAADGPHARLVSYGVRFWSTARRRAASRSRHSSSSAGLRPNVSGSRSQSSADSGTHG
jgi:uncharacterized protein YcbX